jgi:ATP-dependent protease ClpP protease subunit
MDNQLLNLYALNTNRGIFNREGSTIYLYDKIASNDFMAEMLGGVTALAVVKAISEMPGKITMRINCPGGDVFAGLSISQAMREHPGGVDVIVDGVAASIASVIATSANKISMAPGSMMMIHNAHTMVVGDKEAHSKIAETLAKVDNTISAHYASRSTKFDHAAFAGMMAKETWLTAQEAIDAGLAETLIETRQKIKASSASVWDLSAYLGTPKIDPEPDVEEQIVVAGAKIEEPKIDEREQRGRRHAAAMLLRAS